MRLLISWLARTNDFEQVDNKNISKKDGPTFNFHRYHYQNYDKHILLATTDTETAAKFLINDLSREFSFREIELKLVKINDVSDLQEVKTKVQEVLLSLKDYEIDIFFSPGAPMMQMSWYLLHKDLSLKTRLLQLRRFKHSRNKDEPELVEINIDKSSIPVSTYFYEKSLSKKQEVDKLFCPNSLQSVYNDALKVAIVDNITVLIRGNSGTGKELLANYIHNNSLRKSKKMKTLNCSAFKEDLLESRLFGHEKGAFTGAVQQHKGIFEQANKSTVFLDEIGDISPYMQQTLLRTIENKEIEPIGGKTKKVDVRIICATNKNLEKLCREGKFRWDLYYRLSVTELNLPDLELWNRKDKKALLYHFVTLKKEEIGKPYLLKIKSNAEHALLDYTYPGNIREMENLVARLYVFSEQIIEMKDLPTKIIENKQVSVLKLDDVEKAHIEKVLKLFDNKLMQTAKAIGVSYNTFKKKLVKYKINVTD